MTHNLGRRVADGRTFNQSAGLDLVPSPGPLGGPLFVILHFDQVKSERWRQTDGGSWIR